MTDFRAKTNNEFSGISNTRDLLAAIGRLEERKEVQESELREQFQNVIADFEPRNLLKNTFAEVQQSFSLKSNLLKIVLGVGAGYLSRRFIEGKSASTFRKLLGAAIQYGTTFFISKESRDEQTSKTSLGSLFRSIFSK